MANNDTTTATVTPTNDSSLLHYSKFLAFSSLLVLDAIYGACHPVIIQRSRSFV